MAASCLGLARRGARVVSSNPPGFHRYDCRCAISRGRAIAEAVTARDPLVFWAGGCDLLDYWGDPGHADTADAGKSCLPPRPPGGRLPAPVMVYGAGVEPLSGARAGCSPERSRVASHLSARVVCRALETFDLE